jgi:acyl-CoA dehydrogenase family protein 9
MAESSISFMKSLFLGDVREDLVFPYPTMDSSEADMARIITDNLIKWADDNFDAAQADELAKYPEGTLAALAEMGMFGLTIPEPYGGLGLSELAYARIYGALAGIEGSLPVTVGAHCSIGIKGLLLYGSENQKRKYLPDLATGKKLAAFAVTEPGAGSDAASIQTRAVKQPDGSWLLNGQKIWVSNGGFADFYTIFAKTEVMVDGEKKDKISAFIVDWGMEGFTRGPEESKLGIRASSTVPLYFDNVVLPAESLLGEEGKGFKVAMHVLNSGRLSVGAGIVGGARVLLKKIIDHSLERQQFGRPIAEFELIQEKIAQITVNLYVAESMTFLTAGLVRHADIDHSLESAICKVFASERGWNMVNEALQLMGGLGYMKEYPYERALRDARINMIFEGTSEILRLFIALSGMRAPGEYLRQLGKALRDPIKGFGFLADFALTRVREAVTTPQLTAVHPALKPWADYFVQYTERFHHTVESAIMKFGKRVIDRQLMLKRFADVAINLYAMVAVLSRVTGRIQAVGEDASLPEQDIARIFCEDAWRSMRRDLRQIRRHQDRSVRRVAAYMTDRRTYDFPL